MSSVCDSYWSRDYHNNTGSWIPLSETRFVSVGIRAYLIIAWVLEMVDRFRTIWTILSTWYTPLSYILYVPWLISPTSAHSLNYVKVISIEDLGEQDWSNLKLEDKRP